jgi:hypothetical protein
MSSLRDGSAWRAAPVMALTQRYVLVPSSFYQVVFGCVPVPLERLPLAANRVGLGHIAFAVEDVAAMLEAVIANGGSAIGHVQPGVLRGAPR